MRRGELHGARGALHGTRGGFTLLEVLAAAIIFAMVVTVLVGTSSSAVHRIGESARELEADLLAEATLADLEIQIRQGVAPLVEVDETEIEQFVVRTSRTPFAAPSSGAPGARPAIPGASATPGLAGASDAPSLAGSDVLTLLGANLPEVMKFLSQYDVEVSWIEQDGTKSVHRTTFAFDWEAAAIEYADLFARGPGEGAGGAPGPGGDGDGEGGEPTEAQKAAARARLQREGFQPRRARHGDLPQPQIRPVP